MKKVILQACCAPCASYPIKKLMSDDFMPVIFFYNPNIYPFEEYKIRKDELENYCKKFNIEYYAGNFEEDVFYEFIKGYEQEPEKGKRCSKCFYLRLKKTAEFAKLKGIDYFTTTLTVSPHKNSNEIIAIGNEIAKEYNLEFLEYNFKKEDGFKISRQIAKENNMYFQKYCGCKFSFETTKKS